jgi:hypothetical protein
VALIEQSAWLSSDVDGVRLGRCVCVCAAVSDQAHATLEGCLLTENAASFSSPETNNTDDDIIIRQSMFHHRLREPADGPTTLAGLSGKKEKKCKKINCNAVDREGGRWGHGPLGLCARCCCRPRC